MSVVKEKVQAKVKAKVQWPGREEISIEVELDEHDRIKNASMTGVGGPALLDLLKNYRLQNLRDKQKHTLQSLPLPEGESPAALCLREAILKLKGEWVYPFKEEELCHCRAVLTSTVDLAICLGAHTTRKVSEQTSASTACGTCRPDVEAIIKFRLACKYFQQK